MNYSIKIAGLFLFGIAVTSCLKDDMNLDPDTSTNVVEFKNPSSFVSPSGSTYSMYSKSFDLAPEADYPVTVSYSGAHVAPQDITVTLGVDTAAVSQYNAEQEEAFDVIDPSLYTIPATVVIPKGQRTAQVMIKVKPSQFDFSKNYVLPIQIKSASSANVSGNFGTILLALKAKNIYDATYESTGYVYHPTAPRAVHADKHMETVSPNTVKVELGDLGGSGYFANVTVDPKTNKVTITPAAGAAGAPYTQFDTALPSPYTPQWADAGKANNTYDPATKTFYLRYGYMGGNGWRVTEEILVRQ
ncbi:BT_3987 domain-containing protein [Dyadobacter sp.]|uniref:BT_3987 domain-containing protein n=1 Tax=Dyadobacter sp. TaxID=1914288 RepID=UPI003F70E39F